MLLEQLHFLVKIGMRLDYHSYVLGHETITIFGRNSRRKNSKEFGPLVSIFVFLPLLAIFAVVQLPFLPIAALWERARERNVSYAR